MNVPSAAPVRPAGAADRAGLVALARQQLGSATEADAYVAHLLGLLGSGAVTVLVAPLPGGLAGCVTVSAPTSETAGNGATLRYAMIADLYVDPLHRGSGLGRALTDAAESVARAAGAERIALKVLSANGGALDFYRRAGYRERFVVLDRALEEPGNPPLP